MKTDFNPTKLKHNFIISVGIIFKTDKTYFYLDD